jgi:hypothetical protein
MKHLRSVSTVLLAVAAHAMAGTAAAPLEWPVARHDVVWDSPSADAKGSMPLGNGDIGVNVWVEPSGDLVLLVGKSDCFDEFNRLLKLGRIRVKTTPALFQPGQPFSQALRLEDGSIEIKTPTAKLRVWVDANHPVVQVDCEAAAPVEAQVTLENWRKESRPLANEGPGANTAWGNWPDKMKVNADTILTAKPGQLAWCHHNVESQWKRNLELTALGDETAKGKDPVLDRSFGALVRANGFTAASETELKTAKPVSAFSLQIVPLTTFAPSTEAWLAQAEKTATAVPTSTSDRFAAHVAWWHQFWNRSWIDIAPDSVGGNALPTNAHPWRVGMDSSGGSRFGGEIVGAGILPRALSAGDIAALAAAPRPSNADSTPAGKDTPLSAECTLSAWIKPAPGEAGRILDKCTAGQPDGLTFDTHPGLCLRWIVGPKTIQTGACLKPGVWQHVAATVNAAGRLAVYLDGKLVKEETPLSPAKAVSRAYTLQRFVNACAGRGALPIKFNGSLFTVEGRDPDFRAWGGGYWWQNTREAYWTMPYAGDYEMMAPLFKMYREALPLRMAATKKYYGHEGAFYPETLYFWGNYMDENYGFDRKGKPDGLTDNPYIRRYWQSGLELVVMMLDAYDGTQDAKFRDETLLPIAKQITLFYDQNWKRDDKGKIRFDPAQSLETWHTATNPLPEIAGLRFIVPRLLALPADEATKAQWRKLLADLPPVPTATTKDKDGKEVVRIAPADSYGNKRNMENPELYGVFPYRIYTAMTGGKELEQGINAWRVRQHPEDKGWQQNCIQAPLLGLAKEAQAMIAGRAAATAGGYRFPGFFGPNYDWTPEQCHGTNMMTGLQRMLMQCEGDRIVLLPAWPKDWNASFKLHAPKNTVVEAQVENGELKNLKVTPESRRKDVEIRPVQ